MSDPAGTPTGTGAHVAAGVHEGDVLVGKYRIDRILGEGGMGIVAQAHHLQLDERVAIKFLLPEAMKSSETMARFAREARAAVKIKSEHVARVIDVGELETGAPYIVMEFLEGSDLCERLRACGPLPVEVAVEFVVQACEAIAEAHSLGIIHRDLKPANLFIIRRPDSTESAKVLDFGISKTTGMAGSGPDVAMTSTRAMMGSPLYMSPEQLLSARNVDVGTDIWALGVVLYELLAGGPPFQAESFPQLCMTIAQQPPPSLLGFRPDVPPALEAVINRCLVKNRADRYPSIAELVAALAPFAPARARASVERVARVLGGGAISSPDLSEQMAAGAAAAPGMAAASSGVGTQATWGRSTYRRPKGTGVALAIAGVAVVGVVGVVGGVGWLLLRSGSESGAPAAAASAVESPEPSAEIAKEAAAAPSASGVIVSPAEGPRVMPVASASAAAKEKPAASPSRPAKVVPAARAAPKPAAAPRPRAPAAAPKPAPRLAKPAADLYGDRK